MEVGGFDKIGGINWLVEEDGDVAVRMLVAFEVETKKVSDGFLEIGFEFGGEEVFEFCFDLFGFGEVNKIIDEDTEVDWWFSLD